MWLVFQGTIVLPPVGVADDRVMIWYDPTASCCTACALACAMPCLLLCWLKVHLVEEVFEGQDELAGKAGIPFLDYPLSPVCSRVCISAAAAAAADPIWQDQVQLSISTSSASQKPPKLLIRPDSAAARASSLDWGDGHPPSSDWPFTASTAPF